VQIASVLLLCWWPLAKVEAEVPPAAQEVARQFMADMADLEKQVEPKLARQVAKTVAELKKVQDELSKEGKLDEAVAVRDLIRQLQAGSRPPFTHDVPAAKEIYNEHRRVVAKVLEQANSDAVALREKAAKELVPLEAQLRKDDKLDEARALRELIKSIRGVLEIQPTPRRVEAKATDIGKVWYFEVIGADTGGSVWGTDVYTTDSDLGMAAVHAGVLKPGQKGIVKVTILGKRDRFEGSTRHGITSSEWDSWPVSFQVERVARFGIRLSARVLPDPGNLSAYRSSTGRPLFFEVTGSDTGTVYGTGIYTDDSSLATAAVHAGVLAVGKKGVVKVTMLPGQSSYKGSTKNGVVSHSWETYAGSYRVEPAR
jgi:hypothetical protein